MPPNHQFWLAREAARDLATAKETVPANRSAQTTNAAQAGSIHPGDHAALANSEPAPATSCAVA